MLKFAQFFGIMPICKINKEPLELCFKYISLKVFYCILVQFSIGLILSTLIYFFMKDAHFDYGEFVPVVFFLFSLMISLSFLYIAKNLPKLINSWLNYEKNYVNCSSKVAAAAGACNSNTCLYILAIFMSFAFGNMMNIVVLRAEYHYKDTKIMLFAAEHVLSKIADYERASFCFGHYESDLEAFLKSLIPIFFKIFNYSHFKGFFVMLICFYSTVLWNICDVFLIIICCIIYKKIHNLNQMIIEEEYRVGCFLFGSIYFYFVVNWIQFKSQYFFSIMIPFIGEPFDWVIWPFMIWWNKPIVWFQV